VVIRLDWGDQVEARSRPLPAKAWREIQQRAATLGVVAELLADGTEVRLVAQVPAAEPSLPRDRQPRRLTSPDRRSAAGHG
jgi:hypothetical protein